MVFRGGAPPDWAALRRELTGALLLPDDADYGATRNSFIARFDAISPQAIVCAASEQDIVNSIGFARRHGLAFAIRCGGHSAAGRSSTEGLLIDLRALDTIEVKNGAVTVGAGARTGNLSERLSEHGLVVPVGTCPTVGIAGLALGGGFGNFGRKYGLTADHLLAARIVLADGRVVTCSADSNRDLYWALMGAGCGNFGVVTSFTFRTRAIPPLVAFELSWPGEHAASVLAEWQFWAPVADGELNAEIGLTVGGGLKPAADVYGVYMGDEPSARAQLRALIHGVGRSPSSSFVRQLPYRDVLARHATSSVTQTSAERPASPIVQRQGYRVGKSQFFDAPLTANAIASLVETWTGESGRAEGGRAVRTIELAPWGGAYNQRAVSDTAFAHRDQIFLMQHLALVDMAAPREEKSAAAAWVERSWACVQPSASGRVYQNFPDPDLANGPAAYFGENLPRLIDVKRRYDPENVFCFAQSIPMS